jgi:hypothetical protein
MKRVIRSVAPAGASAATSRNVAANIRFSMFRLRGS